MFPGGVCTHPDSANCKATENCVVEERAKFEQTRETGKWDPNNGIDPSTLTFPFNETLCKALDKISNQLPRGPVFIVYRFKD